MVVLPITKGPNFDGSYVTQMFTGASIIPSSLKERYFDLRGSSTNLAEYSLSFSKDSLIFFLVLLSLIKIKFQG